MDQGSLDHKASPAGLHPPQGMTDATRTRAPDEGEKERERRGGASFPLLVLASKLAVERLDLPAHCFDSGYAAGLGLGG